ncbi:MAG: ArsA family ATPase [bacterium]|nr:ArsA family ATPase [bacterium]
MNTTLEELLSRRLLIVAGKGGTGKTTFAAALGTLAARAGIDTVVAEVGAEPVLPRLLSEKPAHSKDPGRNPIRMAPHLFTLHVQPRAALTEFLELQLRVRAVARGIVNNQAFGLFLEAAPGWRELITLGKLWYLTSLETRGKPRWPLVIVDAPATGHGLSLLSVPNVVLETVRLGPLRRHTEAVQRLLRDPAKTLVLPVTLPEELPVNETLELCERMRDLELSVGPMIANGVETPPDLPDLDAVVRSLSGLPSAEAPPLANPSSVKEALQHRLLRSRMHRQFLERLANRGDESCWELPYLAADLDAPSGIGLLSDALGAAL